MPLRSSVWSAASAPGTAGSGICFTQTTTFMTTPLRVGARRSNARAAPDSGKSAAIRVETCTVRSAHGTRRARMSEIRRRRRGRGGAGAASRRPHHRVARRGCSVRVRRQGAASPATRRAATASPTGALRAARGARADARRASAATDAAVVRETVLVSPSGRHVTLPLPADGAARGRRSRGATRRRARRARACDAASTCARHCAVEKVAPHDDEVELLLGDGDDAARAPRDRGRRALVDRAARARTRRAPRSRRVARGAPVLRRRRRRPALGAVRARPPARVRVGVPAAGRRRQRRLRRAARRRAKRPRAQGSSGPSSSRARCCATSSARRRVPTEPVRAWPIPTRYDPTRLAHGRVLFVGDAAGVVDPMTGEGIAQALETGDARGRSDRDGGEPDAVSARYRRSVSRALGRDLRFASRAADAAAHRRSARAAAIAAAGLTPWTRRNFARWMFEDYPARAARARPTAGAAARFSAPGAYRCHDDRLRPGARRSERWRGQSRRSRSTGAPTTSGS